MIPVPSAVVASPRRSLRFAHRLGLAVLTVMVCSPLFARNPQPVNRIPLEPLGFQPLLARYLLAGNSMLTLHYVDNSHLLLTYNSRRLIKRIPGDPLDHQDRIVDALLLALPSGKVLVRTEWHLHDQGQYLWSLGYGQFLLRVQSTLSLIAPVHNLDSGDPFAQHPFLHTTRQIVALRLSPTADLLTMETRDPPPAVNEGSAASPAADAPAPTSLVQINFYRLSSPGPNRDYIIPRVAGGAFSKSAVDLPINATGYLHVIDQGHQRWAFDFNSYSGKVLQLGIYDSTCRPYPILVSPSEFIAFGCHGGSIRQQLGAFNLRGDEMWEQTLSGSYISPNLVPAPGVGRIALSRIIVASAAIETESLSPSEVSAQTVDVYQIDSGKPLLHVECAPVSRAGQNYAFSPDGLQFAIIHEGTIDFYALPPLTDKDQTAIKLAAATAPESNEAPVDLTEFAVQPATKKNTAVTAPVPIPPVPAAPSEIAPVAATPNAPEPTQGDTSPEQPRKPPTLYNPGESKPQ